MEHEDMSLCSSDVENSLVQAPYLGTYFINSTSGFRYVESGEVNDLITFLGEVQRHEIDLLPITWEPGLGMLGDGATARVAQSLLNNQTSLAYKRVFRRLDGDFDLYKRLSTELAILSFPPLRNHPNIVRLEGICWEVLAGDVDILPVFVFETANCGDLDAFMRSERGVASTFEARFRLCMQISDTLAVMYFYGIGHADIKPKNILVHEHKDQLIAKIADFGFSADFTKDRLSSLPQSIPWTAPEHNFQKFTHTTSHKADMFSFGMLVLWLLFRERLLEMSSGSTVWQGSVEDIEMLKTRSHGSLPAELRLLEQLKSTNELINVSHSLVDSTVNFDDQRKCNLRMLFSLTLARDPGQRAVSFVQLTALVIQAPVIFPAIDNRVSDFAPAVFRVSKYIYALQETDYRVSRHITASLQRHAQRSNDISGLNAAFQLAFCYSIGFGVRRNEGLANHWLERSQRSREDLDAERRMVEPTAIEWTAKSGTVRSWLVYIAAPNLGRQYEKLGCLETSRVAYQEAIQDSEESLGDGHWIVLSQKEILSSILEVEEKFFEAETLLLEIMGQIEKNPSSLPNNGWVHMILTRLARIFRTQGKLDTAEKWAQRAMKDSEEQPESLGHLVALLLLGSILCDKLQYQKAEGILVRADDGIRKILGERHNLALAALSMLCIVYMRVGDGDKRNRCAERLIELGVHRTEYRSQEMITLFANGALVLAQQQKYVEAKRLGEEALRLSEEFFGISNFRDGTMIILGNLGFVLYKLGDLTNSESLLRRAINGHTRLLGENHAKTLSHMSCLANVYEAQKKFDAAEGLHRSFLRGQESRANNHAAILAAINKLSTFLQTQGRYAEAERLCTEALAEHENMRELNDQMINTGMISVRWTLGEVYEKQWDYQLGAKMYQQCYNEAKSTFGVADTKTVSMQRSLRSANSRVFLQSKAKGLGIWPSDLYKNRDNLDDVVTKLNAVEAQAEELQIDGNDAEAEDILLAIEFLRGNIYNQMHLDFMRSARSVGALQMRMHRFVFAYHHYEMAFGNAVTLLGNHHPETLAIVYSIAEIFQIFGKYKEAENLYRKTLCGQEEVLGTEDKMTMKTINSLAIVLTRQNRLAEAEAKGLWNLQTRRRLFGEDSEEALESMNTLAGLLRAKGELEQAEQLITTALTICTTQKFGVDHPVTLRTVSNKVANLVSRKEYDTAEVLSRQLLAGMEKAFGGRSPETLESYDIMGMVLYRLGKFGEAETIYLRLVDATKSWMSAEDPTTTTRVQVLVRIQERVPDPWDMPVRALEREPGEGILEAFKSMKIR